jgi:alpha-beta hydrolase superfamily lysophospholipase
MLTKTLAALGLFFLGLCSFALSGGAYLFATSLVRKKPVAKAPAADAAAPGAVGAEAAGADAAAPGAEAAGADAAAPGAEAAARAEKAAKSRKQSAERREKEDALSAHLRDPLIADVIERSRERWEAARLSGQVEELSVRARRRFGLGSLRLHGALWFPQDASEEERSHPALVALLVHGYTGSAGDMAYLAEEYRKRGVPALQVDCRAHGESGGRFIGMGYPDSKDLSLWLRLLRERFGEGARAVLHGVSMGAAAALLYQPQKRRAPAAAPAAQAAFPAPANGSGAASTPAAAPAAQPAAEAPLAAVVADCGFSSLRAQFLNMAGVFIRMNAAQKFAANVLLTGMSVVNFLAAGFFFFQDSPAEALRERRLSRSHTAPLVLFHGEKDALVSADMLDALVKAAGKENVAAEKIPGAPHLGSYFYGPERYVQTIFDALEGKKQL